MPLKNKPSLLKLLLFVFSFFTVVITFAKEGDVTIPVAKKGVIDLRQADLLNEKISLSGEWAIYWKKLITPQVKTIVPTAFVPFPALWKNTIINGSTLTPIGYASYTLTILLPKHTNKLALEIPDTYTSYRIFVNDEMFANSGNPDSLKENGRPKWIQKTIEIANQSDTLYVILQVANFWHSKGGPYKNIVIGDKDKLFSEKEKSDAYDFVLTGCLFMGGLFFLGLYLFGSHDKPILYFALFCITYSYRVIGSGGYVLHSIYPKLSFTLTTHLEYISLFFSFIFFSLYTKYLYPKENNQYAFLTGFWSCVIICAIVVIFPLKVFSQLLNPFLVIMFGMIVYFAFIYIRALLNKRVGSLYSVISTIVLLNVFSLINLQYFGITEPPKGMLFTGYILFFFFQSLTLSFRFAITLKRAKVEAEQGLKAKNEFLSTMSHEIRTPLNSILGMTNLVLMDNPRPEQKEQLNVLLFSANNLLSIVNDILDYNKFEAGKVKFESIETDLYSISKNIVSGFQSITNEKGIDINLHIDPSFQDKILSDPTRISQVLNNLLSNAIKFTRKGHVTLKIELIDQTLATVTLKISVEDTGIGIAQEKQKMIFEQFTQADTSTSRNFGGTGLGLAICKKILELQGSSLHLTSEQGKGSVFYFTQSFPKIVSSEKKIIIALDSLPTEESKPLTGISILLVEDNEVNVLVAKTFLERWGAIVDVAINGQEALNKLDNNKHRIILMDLHMPVMDGYEATRRLRASGIQLPIIALTASLPGDFKGKIQDLGLNYVIVKPFVPAYLFKVILHFTDLHHSTDLKEVS